MSLIIINLNSFFRAVGNLPKVLRFQYYINARWVRTIFLQQFCNMKTYFYKRYKAGCSGKYPNYENLLHHCCEHCQVNNDVCVTEGHLKPVCVCKLAHNYEHCDHSPSGCSFVLSNVWYESYLQAFDEYILWKPQKVVQNIIMP